jgi:hypothetical protein
VFGGNHLPARTWSLIGLTIVAFGVALYAFEHERGGVVPWLALCFAAFLWGAMWRSWPGGARDRTPMPRNVLYAIAAMMFGMAFALGLDSDGSRDAVAWTIIFAVGGALYLLRAILRR